MSKAILVIDMPKRCEECRFSTINCLDSDVCYLNNREISLDKRPNWCPLREVPKKKEENDAYTDCEYYRVQGYNACIDEILEGKV